MYLAPFSSPMARAPNPMTVPSMATMGNMSRPRKRSYPPRSLSTRSPARSMDASEISLGASRGGRSFHSGAAMPSRKRRDSSSEMPREAR